MTSPTTPTMREALEALLRRDEANTCQHDETYRGGAIWEICRQCGAEWADDKGGKPEWSDPQEWTDARAALAADDAARGEMREPVRRLYDVAAALAQRKPLRALAPLSEVSHIGHRQFGRAYEQADEDTRLLACEMADALAALHASRAAAPQSVEPVADPDECEHFCPYCGGSGDVEVADSAGPDARMVPIDCPHCEGCGTLIAAYTGLRKLLDQEHQKYVKLCAEVYFSKHLPAAASEDERKNAARYLWLRDEAFAFVVRPLADKPGADWNAAIDAAMSAQSTKGQGS